jgi:long-chain fatty acid transport protein
MIHTFKRWLSSGFRTISDARSAVQDTTVPALSHPQQAIRNLWRVRSLHQCSDKLNRGLGRISLIDGRRKMSAMARRLLLLVLVVFFWNARDVRADGWKIQLQGVKELGLGYAGRSVPEDASTVWFNPAGMSQLSARWTVTFGAPLISYQLDYTDQGSVSVLRQPLTGPLQSDGGRTSPVPYFYAVRRVNDRWWMGLGFNAPYGLGADYGETWVGRYHATNTELTVFNVNPTVAVKLNERVSVGLGIDVQRSHARFANMIDFGSLGAVLGLPLTPQAQDGKIELDATDWAVGYDLSVAWQVASRVRFASTYRAQVEHSLEGPADFTVPASAAAFQASGAFVPTSASAVLPMPRELSASASFDLNPKWTVVGDLTWTDWSQFKSFVVTFENPAQATLAQDASFADSARGAVGVIYRPNDLWRIRAGALYEDVPVPDATRTPRLPEANNTGFTLGGSYRVNQKWDLDFSWSHLIPHDAPIRLSDPAAGTMTGKVRWLTDAIAVGLNARF